MSQKIWEGHSDPSLDDLTEQILRSSKADKSMKEKAEEDVRKIAKASANKKREGQLKMIKWAMVQKNPEKLLEAIEGIVRRVLIEEKIKM